MINPEGDKKIELGELLRLKRMEQPRPEFWQAFESELRIKQLAAIVRREPWWCRNFRAIQGNARFYIPAGFAALLIVTLIGVRERPRANTAAGVRTAAVLSRGTVSSAGDERVVATVPFAPTTQSYSLPILNISAPGAELVKVDVGMRAESSAPAMVGADLSALNASAPVDSVFAASDSGATDLRASELVEPVKITGSVSSAEPLLRMESPADRRRGRLLASSLGGAGIAPVLATDKVASRLSDDRLTEEAIRRIGARGDRVLVKF